jgi:opacity protein-like surface antigen
LLIVVSAQLIKKNFLNNSFFYSPIIKYDERYVSVNYQERIYNMKKISLLRLFLATTTAQIASAEVVVAEGPVAAMPAGGAPQASGCPKAFQGFHLGANIGYGIGVGKQKFSRFFPNAAGQFNTGPVRSFSNNVGVNGVDGGIGVGYTHRLCNWALGIAFDANWAGTSGKFSESLPGTTPTNSLSLKARLRNSLQLYGRLGYVIREVAMPFVGLGWDNSQWKQNFRENVGADPFAISPAAYTTIASKSKRFNSFMWKAGVDFLATKHVVVGFEYTGTSAGRKSFTKNYINPQTGGVEKITASLKPQYNKFALTAKIVY